jgi:hypothetical protein
MMRNMDLLPPGGREAHQVQCHRRLPSLPRFRNRHTGVSVGGTMLRISPDHYRTLRSRCRDRDPEWTLSFKKEKRKGAYLSISSHAIAYQMNE